MKVKENPSKSIFSKIALKKSKIFKIIAALFVVGIVQFVFLLIIVFNTQSSANLETIKNILTNKSDFIYSFLKYHAMGVFYDVDSININIKHLDFQRLAYERQNALDRKMVKSARDYEFSGYTYVPAKIDYKGKSNNVKIRLKGDRLVHIEDENKWSFRVRLKGDNTLFGLKIFSLHKPALKNYVHEWMFHKALEREDILSLRYKFINVSVNGKNLGIYALEEHFDKILIEGRERKEGPILRFNEDFTSKLSVSPIEPYNKKQWTTPESKEKLQLAVNLLESFRQGDLKISEVFDVKKLATFFAISDMLATHHGAVSKSMRFYYNPITSKFEPIGFDGHHGPPDPGVHISSELGVNPDSAWLYTNFGDWFRMFFNDPDRVDVTFLSEYVRALERVSKLSYLDKFFKEIDGQLEENLTIIHKDFPIMGDHVFFFGPEPFYFTKSSYYKIQKRNSRLFGRPTQRLRAYYGGVDEGELTLEVGNIATLPLELHSVESTATGILYPKEQIIFTSGKLSKKVKETPDYRKIKFTLPKGHNWLEESAHGLIVSYSLLGQEKVKTIEVYPWSNLKKGFEKDDLMRKESNIKEFDFIKLNEAEKTIFIKSGKWTLDKNMIIPKGYLVVANSGTEINFINKSSIVSHSPLKFTGTKESPVILTSKDSTGGGIIVMSGAKTSNITHTIFENLSNPSWGNWSVTGAVTFYKSDVDIKNSEFKSNRSEDGLNIIRSNFNIESSSFNFIKSDALDSDFSSGNIKNTVFNNIGNDAVDFSGGKVELNELLINSVGDKGISLGEESVAIANNINITNTAIAIASKDKSFLTLNNLTISNSQIGLTVFQKKSEYGPGKIIANNVSIKETELPYLVEKNSNLTVDNKKVKYSRENVGELLYGAVYGKSSK